MADTAHTHTAQDSAASRQIRVFLSSTFRDFMEERDLLVKQVFPRLRKQAQERGVEVVDVDLRWGVTQEESEQGKVIGICLAEIDNCRPYFIGMLGERYGWIPTTDKYPALVLEQQAWLQQHVGGASVTELEILHGVLNDTKMAGRAFFYFRDPAWSRAQREPGFVCDTPEEEAKLDALKERILTSDFPVKQGLPDPQAIADQIEADLWTLIEEQYPDLDQADALEREARKHASYRQSRLGVYLGQEYVDQLEALVHGGSQKILITGESGSGKSALIANWIHQHEREHPADVVYAHHLGCSNDANAIRPLLGRMLETASRLLKEAELITEPIQVPQDWWELTAKVAETLQGLGCWCRNTGHRWIWVLDGLDRLADDDQQALPWLPLLIPEGVSVVISALDCPAKAILLERHFQLLEIGPLRRNEQEQLIDSYLERYTKKLDAERIEQILACDLARSPLFLRLLLEELRQCGRFETLETQIADYIKRNADGSLDVNDLYARVLARLEGDCGADPVRKALTALWASRAGLSESELLGITKLVQLQWAPIDLALEKAFGRNGNRLVFDHDHLREAVENRYLPTKDKRRQAHSQLAEWFANKKEWDARKAEELSWQLIHSERKADLKALLSDAASLYELRIRRPEQELIACWNQAKFQDEDDYDILLLDQVLKQSPITESQDERGERLLIDEIADFLDSIGMYRRPLAELRLASLRQEEESNGVGGESYYLRLIKLIATLRETGEYQEAREFSVALLANTEVLATMDNALAVNILNELALLAHNTSDLDKAGELYEIAYKTCISTFGHKHPESLRLKNNMAGLEWSRGNYHEAEEIYLDTLTGRQELLGDGHPDTLNTTGNLALLYQDAERIERADELHKETIEGMERNLGRDHPHTLIAKYNYAVMLHSTGKHHDAMGLYSGVLESQMRQLGPSHPDTIMTAANYAGLCKAQGNLEKAEELYIQALEGFYLVREGSCMSWLRTNRHLADLYETQGRTIEAIAVRKRSIELVVGYDAISGHESLLIMKQLANSLFESGNNDDAIGIARILAKRIEEELGTCNILMCQLIEAQSEFYERAGRPLEAQLFLEQAKDCYLRVER